MASQWHPWWYKRLNLCWKLWNCALLRTGTATSRRHLNCIELPPRWCWWIIISMFNRRKTTDQQSSWVTAGTAGLPPPAGTKQVRISACLGSAHLVMKCASYNSRFVQILQKGNFRCFMMFHDIWLSESSAVSAQFLVLSSWALFFINLCLTSMSHINLFLSSGPLVLFWLSIWKKGWEKKKKFWKPWQPPPDHYL